MARENPQRRENTPPRRRRRPRGVPKALAIALIVLALIVGGGLGYLISDRSTSDQMVERDAQLANATQRIQDLESLLTQNGIDPNAAVFDDANAMLDAATVDALTGGDEPVNNNDALLDDSDSLESPVATAAPSVVAEFGDVQIMSNEVLDAYNAEVNRRLLNGQDVSGYADTLMDETLLDIVSERVKYAKAQELGLTELSEEDAAAIEESAQALYEQDLAFYTVNDGTLTQEEARAQAEELMASDGMTLDTYRDRVEAEWWEEKLREYATQDVTVDEATLQAEYDQRLAEQQTTYTENPDQYEYARRYDEGVVVYNPEGYRTFKQVLIAFEAEDGVRVAEILAEMEALDATADADTIAQLEAELDTLYAKLEPTAEEVLDRVAQGASFDALIEEYSQDPELELASVQSDGYYISAASTAYDEAIKQAVMALQAPGDVSEQGVRSSAGLHVLYYNADVTAGAVPLEDVRSALEAETLQTLRYDAYEAQIAQWVEEAEVVYHREALQ